MTSLKNQLWKAGTLALIVLISLNLTMSGFSKPRHMILQNSEPGPEHEAPGRKVLFILFDALREDYIEWPGDKQPNLDPNAPYAFTGNKVSLFKNLVESQPENTFLVPLRSEMPTITVVRIKTFLSGVTGSVIDFYEALDHGDFKEDNFLVTILKKFKEKAVTIVLGEDIWIKAFGPWFTKEVTLMDQDIRSLDLNDDMVNANLLPELDQGSNFNFMMAHLIGMDHAGHSFDTRHPAL